MEEATTMQFDPRDLQVRAAIGPIDAEKRTFDMVLATETPVRALDMKAWEIVDQVLTCTAAACDLRRLEGSGIGFFEIHPATVYNTETAKSNQIGKIEAVRFENGQCIASVRMSSRPNDPHLEDVWHDIRDGIRTSVSIGFVPTQVTRIETADGQRNQMVVDKWELLEGSLADVAAAPDTAIQRSATAKPADFQMPSNTVQVRTSVRMAAPAAPTQSVNTRISDQKNMEKTPAELQAALDEANTRAQKAEADLADRDRVAEIRMIVANANAIATRSGSAAIEVDEYLKTKQTPEEVRKAVMVKLAEADPNKGASGGAAPVVRGAGPDMATRMELGLSLRSGAVKDSELKPEEVSMAREFRGRSFAEVARMFLDENGVDTRHMGNDEVARAVFNSEVRSGSGAMVSTDFANILGNAINRTLRRAYELAPQLFKQVAMQGNATDFRPMTRTALSSGSRLKRVAENGEITSSALRDGKEVYAIDHYGDIIRISWVSIINDDLGAFNRIPTIMAEQVAQTHSDIFWDMWIANPTMDDTEQVWSTAHANIAASGTALDDANLAIAKKAFRNQKSFGATATNGGLLNLTPEILVVGPELEHQAMKIINGTTVPDTTAEVNLWKGAFMLVVEPRITDKSWYLAARPGRVDGAEYSYLNGREFWTEASRDFDTSGYKWKIESSFGATILDYRGLYLNAGV